MNKPNLKGTYMYCRTYLGLTFSRIVTLVTITALMLLWIGAVVAHAEGGVATVADQPDTPVLTGLPIGVILVSIGMTGLGYLLNYVTPFLKTDPQKAWMTLLYQGIGVAAFEVATNSDFGFNQQTGVAFLTAVGTWAFAHNMFFKPTGWSTVLKAGQNLKDEPAPTAR